jgi:hypothetical protein
MRERRGLEVDNLLQNDQQGASPAHSIPVASGRMCRRQKEVWLGKEMEARYRSGSQSVSHGLVEEWQVAV